MIKVEERFPISEQGYTIWKLVDSTQCQILLDTGASKSFMSKMYYLRCKSLQSLSKFASKTQRIQVGNGQYISLLYIIPVTIDIHDHLEVGWYSLEQDSCWSFWQAFIYCCRLHQAWKGTGIHALIWSLKCLLSMLRGMLGSVKSGNSKGKGNLGNWTKIKN